MKMKNQFVLAHTIDLAVVFGLLLAALVLGVGFPAVGPIIPTTLAVTATVGAFLTFTGLDHWLLTLARRLMTAQKKGGPPATADRRAP
jgi:CBS domain containing-hemolysin-like protein